MRALSFFVGCSAPPATARPSGLVVPALLRLGLVLELLRLRDVHLRAAEHAGTFALLMPVGTARFGPIHGKNVRWLAAHSAPPRDALRAEAMPGVPFTYTAPPHSSSHLLVEHVLRGVAVG